MKKENWMQIKICWGLRCRCMIIFCHQSVSKEINGEWKIHSLKFKIGICDLSSFMGSCKNKACVVFVILHCWCMVPRVCFQFLFWLILEWWRITKMSLLILIDTFTLQCIIKDPINNSQIKSYYYLLKQSKALQLNNHNFCRKTIQFITWTDNMKQWLSCESRSI